MSMEIEAFFNSSTEVTASSWQDEITRLGFPLVIDPGLDIDRVAGFQPAVFRDEKTGFECYRSSGDQSAGRAALRQEVSDRDACITFRWGGDLKEMAAAIGAAAALVSLTDGTLYDPQEAMTYARGGAIELASSTLRAV